MSTLIENIENNRIGIRTLNDGPAPALKSVHVNGQLDGLLLDMRISQHYRNESAGNAEIVYTFPLARDARIMSVDVIIGGKKLRGAVIAKEQARQRYEKAIDTGDTPVMVEETAPGLFTANLGNIKPGERVSVAVCYAQLLRFEQGRIRLSVPTVIAPRYGDAYAKGGLQPHETADASLAADYPLTLALNLPGETAAAQISSPSHPIAINRIDASGRRSVTIAAGAGATLDRDFILVLDGLAGRTFAHIARDATAADNANVSSANASNADVSSTNVSNANASRTDASSADVSSANVSNANVSSADTPRANASSANEARPDSLKTSALTMLASFCPAIPRDNGAPLALKILVDCSGSMAGDSIRSAKEALHRILAELDPADYVSLSRFGTRVEHAQTRLEPCDDFTIHCLDKIVQRTGADLGGTELRAALLSTFRDIAAPARDGKNERLSPPPRPPAVLLITDGEIWDVKGALEEAQRSGHRVFAVGLGSAPAETLHRELAEKTGGACEIVSPNEDIAAAIVRMFHRMRAATATNVRVEWGEGADGQPLWQSAVPRALYDGETVHLFAQFTGLPKRTPRLVWKTGSGINAQTHTLRSDALLLAEGAAIDSLPRLAGAQKMTAPETTPLEKKALALRYQLIGEYTNLFLVHVRAEDDKAAGLPTLQQVPQMPAAGWGGMGSVKPCTRNACYDYCDAGSPPSMPAIPRRTVAANKAKASSPLLREMPHIFASTGAELLGGDADEKSSAFNLATNAPSKGKTWEDALRKYSSEQTEMFNLLDRLSLQNTDFEKIIASLSDFATAYQAGAWGTVFILNHAIAHIAKETGAAAVDIWAVLLGYLIHKTKPRHTPARHTKRLLRQHLKTTPCLTRRRIIALWEKERSA